MSLLSMLTGDSGANKEVVDKMNAISRTQAIIEFDLDGNILSANDNFLDVMGYSSHEVLGKHHKIFISASESNGSEYRNFWSRLNRGETISGEFKRYGRANKTVWIHGSYMPLMGENGKPYKVVKVAVDITARKESEQQAKQEASYASALQACQANVMLADNDLNIVYMNDTVTEMMKGNEDEIKSVLPKFSANNLIGFNVDGFHDDPSHQRKMLNGLKEPYKTSIKVGKLTFDLIATPWMDSDGKRLGTLVEWDDATARLATALEAKNIADANLRISQSLDVCDAAVMLADNDLNIIYMNKSSVEMMADREAELKVALPKFNASTLIGTCVDDFHVNPAHQRKMLKRLTEPYRTDLPVANVTFGLIATPIFGDNGERLGTVVEWDDKTERLKSEKEAQEQADINSRISQSLDVCDTAVMLADSDLNIIYMNKSSVDMMATRESDLRSVLPNFNSKSLVGTCVDDFHKNPAHQRGMLKDLKQTYRTDLPVGDITFGLIATPLFNDAGERLGTVVEWDDKTERLAQEAEAKTLADSNARISQSLDVCDTSVMVADADLNIIYINKAAGKMMTARESELRSALPNFNASTLIGTCVDDFHKNPAHQRGMLRDLKGTYRTDLPVSGITFGLIATPLLGDDGERLGTVVEWEDKTERLAKEREEQRVAAENARVKQALDNVGANVMIADNDCNIIYLNDSVVGMMNRAESDIRKDLPNFNASKLQGANIDVFHKNPAYQRGMLENLTTQYEGKAEVGGRSFTVVANPIVVNGERLGTVVEWNDRTEELKMEVEIDGMVEGAASGDFSRKISLEGKAGFFGKLGKGLNDLTGTVEVALNDVNRMLGAMARGDLSERITREYDGAFGQLKTDANGTADKLTEVLGKIRGASGSILSSANEISAGNADLSQRTEEQASALEETASSMEEMTSTVKQSADNSQKASDLSGEAQTKAREGGEVVVRAVAAMEAINSSSKKISDIIGVIDEIAFQTNLLALNAAVEAARAGEQGRGFAVVAGEVRNLAQRSAGAAKEIKDLISDSVEKVQDGRELVNASGKTLDEIVIAVEKVSEMMRDLSDSAREQTSGIEQVNTAISQMDEMTQQNAALVEEASAAGAALADQANQMNSVVAFFSIGGSSGDQGGYSAPAAPLRSVGSGSSLPKASGGNDEWEDF